MDMDIDVEVDVDIDSYVGSLKQDSESFQALFNGIAAVVVLTLNNAEIASPVNLAGSSMPLCRTFTSHACFSPSTRRRT